MNTIESADFVERIAANIRKVQARINAACEKSRRDPADVRLIAVTKNFPSSTVRLALKCGLHDFGENRVQEAHTKFSELSDIRQSIRLHFIGHLQTNKVREALEISDVIHSIDSLRLARELNEKSTRILPALVQVNVASEETKYGFPEGEAEGAIHSIRDLKNIGLTGLMTIAPIADDPEEVRPVFSRLREMGQKYGLKELSMGMTDDFEVAIEEGSTMVRIGRAIFGERS